MFYSILRVLIVFLSLGSVSFAQVVFPLTLKVAWDPNPVMDNVTGYIVTIDGNSQTITPAICSQTICQISFVINVAGPHTVNVQAENQFGVSPANAVTFSAIAPGKSNNVKITK